MTREKLRRELYEKTGQWYSDDEMDDYMGYSIQDESYSDESVDGDTAGGTDNTESFSHPDEDESLLQDDIISEVNDLFATVLKKAKASLEEKAGKIGSKEQLAEITYFTKIFACKCVLYIILQNGSEKGYMWKYL